MFRRFLLAPAARLGAFLCAVLAGAMSLPAGAAPIVPTHFNDELVAGYLDLPTNGAFLPDGRMLVTEHGGRIRVILPNSDLVPPIAGTVDSLATSIESGLIGIAIDPGWPARPYIYVQAGRSSPNQIVIWRYRMSGNLTVRTAGGLTLITSSRYTVLAIPDLNPSHNGGTLRFGPDNMLYASVGDDNLPCDAQDLTKLTGKILRLDVLGLPDGAGGPPRYSAITPANNPFVARADSSARLVWAYGLRNPFAFQVDPSTGCLVVGDVGNEAWEEIDHVCAGGMNFGWPHVEGPERTGGWCASPDTANPVAPSYSYPHAGAGWVVVGGPVYHAPPGAEAPYPASYEGTIFLGDTWRGLVRNLTPSGSGWMLAPPAAGQPDAENWGTGADWITHLEVGPDGALWYLTLLRDTPTQGPGEVRRIVYYEASADAPAAPGEAVRLAPPRPSPARGSADLAWVLPEPARVNLTLFDARGRAVRRLVRANGRLSPAGPGAAHWDGADDAGVPAPPGVYFVRLDAGAAERTVRLVLLR